MEKIGLTGGIGSGKTTIAKMFEELGVPVYYSDDEAKKLMHTSSKIKEGIIQLFGKESFRNDELNRTFIANIVFKDKDMLKKLNVLVHPEVEKHFDNWAKSQHSKYVIQENAIIFESGSESRFDKIITVTAPNELKMERVQKRDHVSKEKVLERMQNQLDDKYKIDNSYFVINNLDLEDSKREVEKIHNLLKNSKARHTS